MKHVVRVKPAHLNLARRSVGFSLIEVLVALIIIGVGMLGLAKIQALAYASTGTASQRSIAAIEAASIAAGMHANRNYWAAGSTALSVTVQGTTITPSDAALSSTVSCLSGNATPCTAANLAAYDLHQWVADLNSALAYPLATINCPVSVAGPPNCSIQLNWTEHQAAINQQSQGNAMTTTAYTLYVVP